MSIIEQATKRLEVLARAGATMPWSAAGLAGSEIQRSVDREAGTARLALTPVPAGGEEYGELRRAAGGERPSIEHETITLDIAQLERTGQLIPMRTRSAMSEEFRHIKRPLLQNARESGPERRMSLIMVTSALPGEGKTFCAINLAASMAMEIDTSVLLVDADVVRASVLKRLGIAPRKGLLDVLADRALGLDSLVLKTNIPKLSILPAGCYNDRTTELLASDAMDRLLADLASSAHGQVVVFDSPPLLITSEAKVLASHVGQVVMVTESSKTPRRAVEMAFAAVEQCPCVMSVLNKGPQPQGQYGYQDYYG